MRVFTKTLSSGSISIASTDGVTQISVQANDSSECTVQGNFPFQGGQSDAISLTAGQSLTITAPVNSPLEGVVISWVSGTVDVIIGF